MREETKWRVADGEKKLPVPRTFGRIGTDATILCAAGLENQGRSLVVLALRWSGYTRIVGRDLEQHAAGHLQPSRQNHRFASWQIAAVGCAALPGHGWLRLLPHRTRERCR
jgi:hypothetical protein